MNALFQSTILKSTGAVSFNIVEQIQSLWSGYGSINRVQLQGSHIDTVIIKHVKLPTHTNHPRGWNTDIGHQRKVKSYQVETNWYKLYSNRSKARLANCLATEKHDDEVLIVLEDLDAAGFPFRNQCNSWTDIESCISWLAKFHASYLDLEAKGLWPIGSYWHLDTRPNELEVLDDLALKEAAPLIDAKLNGCQFKSFVHGDAKLANFCFSPEGHVAGVDFQYVGAGCGMKDLAYFIGSCLNESDCEKLESQILNSYFEHFHNSQGNMNESLENEWRSLYRVAWADFHRFIKGWSPGHWKINSYSERVTKEVISQL